MVAGSTIKRRDMTPVMQGPVNDTGEEPFSPSRRIWQIWPVSWLLSGAEEQVEFHVSTCTGAVSPTSARRSEWERCLRRAATFA